MMDCVNGDAKMKVLPPMRDFSFVVRRIYFRKLKRSFCIIKTYFKLSC